MTTALAPTEPRALLAVTLRLGSYTEHACRYRVSVTVRLTPTPAGPRLSITGETSTQALSGGRPRIDTAGQCRDEPGRVTDFAPGWDAARVARLAAIWERWHLNDFRAGCEHQRAEGWDQRPIDPFKPLSSYDLHHSGQRYPSWNMLTWVRAEEVPGGLLLEPCETCGYKYGSAWQYEALPEDVLTFLYGLRTATPEEPA